MNLYLLDAPFGKPYFISPVLTYTASNSAVLTCSIISNGNPAATWTWKCGSRTFTSGITNTGTQSQLMFSVGKNDNGQQCTCRALSTVGSYNSVSDPVTLNIQCEYSLFIFCIHLIHHADAKMIFFVTCQRFIISFRLNLKLLAEPTFVATYSYTYMCNFIYSRWETCQSLPATLIIQYSNIPGVNT